MSKLPFMKWYPADFDTATSIWSLEEIGAWLRILHYMWMKRESRVALCVTDLSRLLSQQNDDMERLCDALVRRGVATNTRDDLYEFYSKRIEEDLERLKNQAERQEKHRKSVTLLSRSMSQKCHRQKSEVRSQKTDRRKITKTPFWTEVCKHLEETWKRKKNAPFLFTGQRMKSLKGLCQTYQPWGVMALWDMFLVSDDPWIKDTGYKFEAFVHSVDKLVDNYSWKQKAQIYEGKLYNPISALPLPAGSSPEVIKSALDSIIKRP